MKQMFIVAAIAAITPVAAFAQTAPMPATYVMKAGAADLFERQSSQLLLQSTRNPKLKAFAQQMITDHTKSTAEVKAAAMQAKVPVAAPRLDAAQTRMMAEIRAAKGTQRDTVYIADQKKAHAMALQLHQTYAADGTSQPLKMAAAKIAPVVEHHIQELDAM